MENEAIKALALVLLSAAGGVLVGMNARLLSNGANALLFVLGLALIAMSATWLGWLEAMWKRRFRKKAKDQEE